MSSRCQPSGSVTPATVLLLFGQETGDVGDEIARLCNTVRTITDVGPSELAFDLRTTDVDPGIVESNEVGFHGQSPVVSNVILN